MQAVRGAGPRQPNASALLLVARASGFSWAPIGVSSLCRVFVTSIRFWAILVDSRSTPHDVARREPIRRPEPAFSDPIPNRLVVGRGPGGDAG